MNKHIPIYILLLPFLAIVMVIITYITINPSTPKENYYTLRSKAADLIPTLVHLPTSIPLPTSTPLPTPIPREETFKHPSPDGKVQVELKAKYTSPQSTEYTVSTMDSDGSNSKVVYQTILSGVKFQIPFNSWSPDNRYFFIEKNTGEAYVFTRTGENITSSEQFFSVKDIFSTPDRVDRYDMTTGWASPTLLIIHTKNLDNSKGSSYWFEVPSQAIIQLSGDF
jgi:hypothetical protein